MCPIKEKENFHLIIALFMFRVSFLFVLNNPEILNPRASRQHVTFHLTHPWSRINRILFIKDLLAVFLEAIFDQLNAKIYS
jgi:hypothetical protein